MGGPNNKEASYKENPIWFSVQDVGYIVDSFKDPSLSIVAAFYHRSGNNSGEGEPVCGVR